MCMNLFLCFSMSKYLLFPACTVHTVVRLRYSRLVFTRSSIKTFCLSFRLDESVCAQVSRSCNSVNARVVLDAKKQTLL